MIKDCSEYNENDKIFTVSKRKNRTTIDNEDYVVKFQKTRNREVRITIYLNIRDQKSLFFRKKCE